MNLNTITIEEASFELVKIPQGEILLNDDRIKKKWAVEIDEFYLAKFPVTQALYFQVMEVSPSTFEGDNRPVESVAWIDAVNFCNRLSLIKGLTPCYKITNDEAVFRKNENGYRLSTEAEWQYACQANTGKIRYGELNDIAWFKENAQNETHEVGLKQPNEWGLYDMLGNVWEWCSDIYDEEVYGAYRIFRGGGWADVERSVMATNRRRSHPTAFKIDDLGFRIARNT
ncbi:sulfatase-modifying factor protein [marine bacterium AO1-C]|nr:sulfatase-modifying factor protein [marine bacterium AO1-C]